MDQRKRIEDDIKLFDGRISGLASSRGKHRNIAELATQYRQDAEHYLKTGDLFTSFGCITYAHGLIDALRDLKSSKKEG